MNDDFTKTQWSKVKETIKGAKQLAQERKIKSAAINASERDFTPKIASLFKKQD